MIADGSIIAIHLGALTGSVAVAPPRHVDREERSWIARALNGEEQAFRLLLERYRTRIVRLAAVTLGSTSDAEDAALDAFLKAFRTLHQYRADGSFYSWLCRITIRTCIDTKRGKKTPPISPCELSESDAVCETTNSSIEVMLVHQLLLELSPPMRAALVLREMDGLEYEDIAAALAIPVGTVRSRLNAARAQFKRLVEKAIAEEDAIDVG